MAPPPVSVAPARPGGAPPGDGIGPPGTAPAPAPVIADRAELVTAVVLLGGVVVLAGYLHRSPGPTMVDRLLTGVVPARHHAALLAGLTRLGSAPVLLAGSVAGCLATARRQPARALALLAGPVLAVAAGDEVLKPVVGRTLDGVLTFPSGTVTAVAALATAAVLATPDAWRWLAAVLGTTATVMAGASAVALGWHFPTDTAGGAALGVGVVLATDWMAGRILWRRGGRRPGGRRPAGRHRAGPAARAGGATTS